MNRKAQSGIIGTFVLFIIFLIIWLVWLGGWVGGVGKLAVTSGNLTGIEAFFFTNLNFFIFIGALLGLLGFVYFSSGQ